VAVVVVTAPSGFALNYSTLPAEPSAG